MVPRAPAARTAVLFELENLGTSGRLRVFETLRKKLHARSIPFTIVDFQRHFTAKSVKCALPSFLAAMNLSKSAETKLSADISQDIAAHYGDGKVSFCPVLRSLLDAVLQNETLAGCLTALEPETSTALAERFGLSDMAVRVMPVGDTDKPFPSPDSWLKLAKSLHVKPTMCAALVTSRTAARSAISAGMRVVAVPDQFTAFQDFGGADAVCDSIEDVSADRLLRLFAG